MRAAAPATGGPFFWTPGRGDSLIFGAVRMCARRELMGYAYDVRTIKTWATTGNLTANRDGDSDHTEDQHGG